MGNFYIYWKFDIISLYCPETQDPNNLDMLRNFQNIKASK
jgi:hypothetical protein